MVSPFDSSDAHAQQRRAGRLHAEHGGRKFVIEHDAAAGFYLYVFEADRCTYDYLQDSLASAREFAAEEFGVSEHVWREGTPTI